MSEHRYPDADITAIERVIRKRRYMRHFVPGELPAGLIERLIAAAHDAPSVGYMQPWRFVRVAAPENRKNLYRLVDAECLATAAELPSRAAARNCRLGIATAAGRCVVRGALESRRWRNGDELLTLALLQFLRSQAVLPKPKLR